MSLINRVAAALAIWAALIWFVYELLDDRVVTICRNNYDECAARHAMPSYTVLVVGVAVPAIAAILALLLYRPNGAISAPPRAKASPAAPQPQLPRA